MRDVAWDDVEDIFDPLANGTLPDVRIEGSNLDDSTTGKQERR